MIPKKFFHDFRQAASANFLPAAALQCIAFFVLWSYYSWPAAQYFLDQVGQFKSDFGYGFAFVASAFSGAVLPLALQGLQRGAHRRLNIALLPSLLLFWGLRGCVVDVFYLCQSMAWGNNSEPQTLAIKIVCDLGMFTPLIGVPTLALMFNWLNAAGSSERFRSNFTHGFFVWYQREAWPLIPASWMVWLPALIVIYALPINLQFPISIIIQCFWALFLVVLTDKSQSTSNSA